MTTTITLYDVEGNRYEAEADEIVGYGDNGTNCVGSPQNRELFLCVDCHEAALDDVQADFLRPISLSEFYQGYYVCHLCDQLLV